MPADIIIAIDGVASSGKSTLAKQLAAALNYHYVDSGAFYRAVTLFFVQDNIDWKNENVISEIRSLKFSNAVSEVSTIPAVRNFINQKLREYGMNKKVVMDGRDIGTVVFPNAELKIFLTAEEKIRSNRRFQEMK